jgi:hypothetical protein
MRYVIYVFMCVYVICQCSMGILSAQEQQDPDDSCSVITKNELILLDSSIYALVSKNTHNIVALDIFAYYTGYAEEHLTLAEKKERRLRILEILKDPEVMLHVRRLVLRDYVMDDEIVNAIVEIANMRKITLNNCHVGLAHLEKFNDLAKLTRINMHSCQVYGSPVNTDMIRYYNLRMLFCSNCKGDTLILEYCKVFAGKLKITHEDTILSSVPIQGTEHHQDEVNAPPLDGLENDSLSNGANQEIDPEE